jgi:hypothetical protein
MKNYSNQSQLHTLKNETNQETFNCLHSFSTGKSLLEACKQKVVQDFICEIILMEY